MAYSNLLLAQALALLPTPVSELRIIQLEEVCLETVAVNPQVLGALEVRRIFFGEQSPSLGHDLQLLLFMYI